MKRYQGAWRARKAALKGEVSSWQHTAWRYATAWRKAKAELAVGAERCNAVLIVLRSA